MRLTYNLEWQEWFEMGIFRLYHKGLEWNVDVHVQHAPLGMDVISFQSHELAECRFVVLRVYS